MSGKLKRMWPAAAASLLALSSVAQANNGTGGDMSRAKQRPNSMNAQNGQHVAQVINPPARPVVKDGVDLFLQGEFLWWRPSLDDNQFAAACGVCPAGASTDANGFPTPILNTYGMSVLSPDYSMEPGFRLGIGYNMPYDGWDVYLRWTRLHATASKCAPCKPCCGDYYTCDLGCETPCDFDCNTGCDTGCDTGCNTDCDTGCDVTPCEYTCAPVPCEQPCDPCDVPECMQTMIINGFPSRGTFDNFLKVCDASIEWKLKLDLIDLEMGREFYVSRKLTLRPHFGLRQAWVDMAQTARYSNNLSFPLIIPEDYNSFNEEVLAGVTNNTISMKNRFRGIGPRAGLDSRWMLGSGVSVIGEAAFSILYGHFTVESNCCTCIDADLVFAGYTVADTRPSQLKDSFFSSKAVADLGLGLEWAKAFADDRWGVAIALLWDNSLFFNQNQQIGIEELASPSGSLSPLPFTKASLSSRRHGDFSTQGLTVRARLDF